MSRFISLLLLTVVVGSVYAMAATGLVLTYRTSRVFNFAHGAVGMFFAYVFRQLWVEWGVPLPVAMALVVGVIAPACGIAMERAMFRPLREAATAVKVVVTVGLLISLQGLAGAIWGRAGLFVPALVPLRSFRIGPAAIGSEQLLVLVVAAGVAAGLALVVTRTGFGLRVRAVVDRPELAELEGIDAAHVSRVSWGVGFGTAALAGILLSPLIGLSTFTLTLLVIQAYAAALIGRLASLGLTFVGGLVIAFLEQSATLYLPSGCDMCRVVKPAIPFLLIFVVLAVAAAMPRGRFGAWVQAATAGEPSAPPPQPRERQRRLPPAAIVAAGMALLAVVAPTLGPRWLLRTSSALALVGVFASLSVLTGLSGQISLGHTAFVGTGAFVMAALAGSPGLPWPLALLFAGLAAVPVGIAVALPAIRLQGLFLALLTFGYGLVAQNLFASSLTGAASGMEVARPSMATSDLGYFYVLLVLAGLALVAGANLETSPSGRILGAIRDGERAVRAIGISPGRYKLAAFALSAFMAGLAGAGLGGLQTIVTYNDFNIFFSLIWLAVAVIGGVGSIWGAALAGLVWLVGTASAGSRGQMLFGLGAMLLARHERGIAGGLERLRARAGQAGPWARGAVAAYAGHRTRGEP